MLIILVCIGSSCHIKGSHEIVRLLQNAIEKHDLSDQVTLSGSFCIGKCNREGVTVQINDEIFTGITPANFDAFFNEHILNALKGE